MNNYFDDEKKEKPYRERDYRNREADEDEEDDELPKTLLFDRRTNLIGPVSLTTHISDKYNKRLVILGDFHVKTPICSHPNFDNINVSEFVYRILDNSEKEKINVFFEEVIETFPRSLLEDTSTFIDELLYLESIFQNVSLEAIDIRLKTLNDTIRSYDDLSSRLSDIVDEILDDKFNYETSEIASTLEKTYPNLTRKSRGWVSIYTILYAKKFHNLSIPIDSITATIIENETGIAENLKNIPDENVSKKIRDYFNKKLEENTNDFLTFEISYLNYLENTGSYMMDFYVISKIFSSNDKNFVIYTGDFHSRDYREFLQELGFGVVQKFESKTKEKNYQCIYVSDYINIFKL